MPTVTFFACALAGSATVEPSNAKAAQRNDVNYVGSFAGAMAQSPSDSSPDEMLPGDLETAKLFGARVAEIAAKFSK